MKVQWAGLVAIAAAALLVACGGRGGATNDMGAADLAMRADLATNGVDMAQDCGTRPVHARPLRVGLRRLSGRSGDGRTRVSRGGKRLVIPRLCGRPAPC